MTWKKLNNGHRGRSDVFGGVDIDKISSVFDGTADIDTVDINSLTTVRDDKLRVANIANTFAYTASTSAITADRNMILPQILTDGTFLMQDMSQIMTNKAMTNCIFDATQLPVSRFVGDPNLNRWGTIFPRNAASSLTGVASMEGMLSRHTLRSPNGTAPDCDWMFPGDWYAYNGQYFRLENTSTEGDWCGILSPTTGTGLCRMSHDGRIRMRWKQESTTFAAFWCGLSSNASAAPLNYLNPLGNTHSGILIGNSTNEGEWSEMAIYHNGDGSSPRRTEIVSGSDLMMDGEVFNDLDIRWWTNENGLNATASVKSAVPSAGIFTKSLVRTGLPAANTDLYFHCHLINTGGDSQSLGVAGVWIESR